MKQQLANAFWKAAAANGLVIVICSVVGVTIGLFGPVDESVIGQAALEITAAAAAVALVVTFPLMLAASELQREADAAQRVAAIRNYLQASR